MSRRLDWVIVGGGPLGVHAAVALVDGAGVPLDGVALVDPEPALLGRWHRLTGNTGMPYLRSPAVHHLDLDPWSVHRFARVPAGRGRSPDFTPPYDRPATDLFAAHCAEVIERVGLAERHVRGRVARLDLGDDEVMATLEDGRVLVARRAVLALGVADRPCWPAWAEPLRAADGPVQHVFGPGFVLRPEACGPRVAVVGAGITGAQVALRIARAGREVTLLSRHELREHAFDSDPGWIGPRNMEAFAREGSLVRRREMIRAARHRGSVPPDVHRATRRAIERGELGWRLGAIEGLERTGAELRLRLGDGALTVDTVLLATGFDPARPGGALVDDLVARYGLCVAPCGYPVVDRALRWHPRLHLTGALAELEIGPTARNLSGARRAGERLLSLARREAGGAARGAA